MRRLALLGYRPKLGTHALAAGPLYYAGSVKERLSDLHAAFADETVDAILCTRGGWGSAELLPYLDAALIRANPKPFIGYSDHTSLHLWFQQRAGLVTFYGPMVSPDFARAGGVHPTSWSASLRTQGAWSVGRPEGLRVLRPGRARGVLHGGCLSILAESLGTSFAALPRDGILFLEDVGTKPYQWDRMLLHLRYAGLLAGVHGIVFGDMGQCVGAEDNDLLEQAILHALQDFEGPIGIGLQSGHVDSPNVTLPLGAAVTLELTEGADPRLDFADASSSV